jgi:hypothetical protein
MKLSSHFHLVPKLRMRGAVPPFPHTSSCCGTRRLYYLYFHHALYKKNVDDELGNMKDTVVAYFKEYFPVRPK